ncbi:ABC transporter ATP-binding protein [Paenibacillus sp. CAA11]|uniref:ABC transporter ATP-binding protein n=1 Tax=Paenibacillus sp. CAA11 TaxID=1532905 RepID=UPI000D340965|nr:ABC transporter ATP-binding protein [Paenibacillus sp. CAA11]AWB44575.1 ABC transporter ATP-binding protein [Paenibacillus sp. CAA11]
MQEKMIEVDHVTRRESRRVVIKDMSFCLRKGKIYGLIGPNGAGKSTLIRLMTGMTQPSGGHIRIHGDDVHSERSIALRQVGALIETPAFFKSMTGRQALRNLSRLHSNISSAERESYIEKLLKDVKLLGQADQKIKSYSLGMKQRLGIAQAMLGDPEVIILDEPANGLDPLGVRILRNLLTELRDTGNRTILISSHLLDEIQQICDEVLVIRSGEVIWQGATSLLASEGQRLEDAFLELGGWEEEGD